MLIQINNPIIFVLPSIIKVLTVPKIIPIIKPTILNKKYITYLLLINDFLETGVIAIVFIHPDVLSIVIVDATIIPSITVARTVNTQGFTRYDKHIPITINTSNNVAITERIT